MKEGQAGREPGEASSNHQTLRSALADGRRSEYSDHGRECRHHVGQHPAPYLLSAVLIDICERLDDQDQEEQSCTPEPNHCEPPADALERDPVGRHACLISMIAAAAEDPREADARARLEAYR